MGGRQRSDLLTPVLSQGDGQAPSIYSLTVILLAGFFGGPFAVIFLTAVNAQLLGRFPRDMFALLLALVATLALLYALVHVNPAAVPSFIDLPADQSLLIRGWALLLFGVSAAMHGRAHRNLRVSSTPRPPHSLLAGLAAALLGLGATWAVKVLMQ